MPGHLLGLVRMGGREVVRLGTVLLDVVELPTRRHDSVGGGDPAPDQLPFAIAYEGVVLMLHEKRFAAFQRLPRKAGRSDRPSMGRMSLPL